MVLVHELAAVQVCHVMEGLVSVVKVQACWALTAATKALTAAMLLYILATGVDYGNVVGPGQYQSQESEWCLLYSEYTGIIGVDEREHDLI